MAFSIQVVDRKRRVGRIDLGDFSERFQISGRWPLVKFEDEWRQQLSALVERRRKAMLPTAATMRHILRAWILYRDRRKMFVQERYYFRRPFRRGVSRIDARRIRSEDGRMLSEWSVPMSAVVAFLSQKPNKAPEPTTMAVTSRAPSSTSRASHGRGSS
jgi:hypothetical protein